MLRNYKKLINVALLVWSATFVYSCACEKTTQNTNELKPIMESDSLDINNYESGRLLYNFKAPHLIQYKSPDTAYTIFDKGIHIVTYDSLGGEKTWLTAKYAIFRDKISQWEARDSVVAKDKDGKILKTDLIYWDQKDKRIHSPIKTTVFDGDEVVIGENGFESDEELNDIQFIKSQGRILVDTTQNNQPIDTTQNIQNQNNEE